MSNLSALTGDRHGQQMLAVDLIVSSEVGTALFMERADFTVFTIALATIGEAYHGIKELVVCVRTAI